MEPELKEGLRRRGEEWREKVQAETIATASRYVDATYGTDPDQAVLRVWRFEDAPTVLQDLSNNGGDEDWLLLIPDRTPYWINWAERGTFGCCCVDEWVLPNGWKVRIGCHS